MNQYIADKGILFRMLNGLGTKVLNINDQTFKEYHPIKTNKTIAYSSESHASTRPDGVSKLVYLTDIHVSATGSSAILHQVEEVTNDEGKLTLSMAGAFNLENALAAFCLARACGIQTTAALTALSSFTGVAGRMERIPSPAPFAVFVDFTVTPEAYRKTLTSLRSMLEDGKRLLVLTGSCGERMREKRPLVGQICSELADVVIVTNEDPYGEDPEKIIDEVWAGIDQSKVQAHRISDRMKAITWIFEQATPGDIVLLAGKGSDTTMWVKEGKIPWNERDIAHSLLANLG
jgi:UDP-N-acetylmuramyl-tripeptide synthetase